MAPSKKIKAVNPPARVTISDVADALGVTKSTVSRALNGYPDISERMRRRVKTAVAELGYRPLAQAQAIRTGRARALGLVLQIDEHDGHRPFLTDFLAGVSEAASAAMWSLTVSTARSTEDTQDTLGRLVEERKADGFILPRTYIDDPRAAFLKARGVPFVLYGRTADTSGCAWYDILGERAMEAAVLRLARLGHRRIAYIGGGVEYNYSVLRKQGFLDGVHRTGLAVDPSLIAGPAVSSAQGRAEAHRLLALETPPTAIVCAVDAAALGVYRAAADLGLRIGSDLSVISYDGIPEGLAVTPQLTTFAVDNRRAGTRLAELLIERVEGAEPEELRETERAKLVPGGSDGPPARNPAQLAAYLSAMRGVVPDGVEAEQV
ncbi:MAG: substrate-binding domain-containing protein [Pseudomonadota bacterium]